MPDYQDYHDYSMKCRNCHYTHYYGNAPLSCRTKASSHAVRKMHIVDIRDSGKVVETVGHESQTVISSDPPF